MEVHGPGGPERRIARRVAADGLRVWVNVVTPRPWRQPRVDRLDCDVLDMSVTGARLLAPASPVWTVGNTVVVHADPTTTAEVAVMRVIDAGAPDHVAVGVDFRRQTPSFTAMVKEILAQGDTATEWRWHRAAAD